MKEIDKNYRISLLSGLISTLLIGLTYIKQPEDPNFAGSVFAYNFTFFFPMLFLAFISGLICLIFLIKHRKSRKRQSIKGGKKWVIPLVLIIPIGFHAFLLIFNIFRIQFQAINYKNDYYFTTQKIEYNDSLNIYIHGAIFGDNFEYRMVYVTDESFTSKHPDINYCYYYEGNDKDKLSLFYKLEDDTIKLFVPNEIANRNKMFDKRVNVLEIGCDEQELIQMAEDYYKGLRQVKQFYWGFEHKK